MLPQHQQQPIADTRHICIRKTNIYRYLASVPRYLFSTNTHLFKVDNSGITSAYKKRTHSVDQDEVVNTNTIILLRTGLILPCKYKLQ